MITVESVVSTICLDVINVLLIDYFFSSLYDNEKEEKTKYLYLTFILCIYLVIHLNFLNGFSTILLDFIFIVITSFYYMQTSKKILSANLIIILTYYLCDLIIYQIFVIVFSMNFIVREIFMDNIVVLFRMIISKYLIYTVIHYILYRKNRLTDFKVKIFKYISFGVSVFYGITILVFYHEILFYHVSVGRIFVFTLLLYNVVLIIFNYYQKMHIRTVSELDLLKQSIDYQKEYLHKVIETEETLRKIKHDTVHAYVGMHGMAKEGKYEELISYLETFIKETKEIEKVSYFGDSFIDSIICHKISDAREKEIEIEIECGMISIGKIASTDLGILTANALSNAIEAAEKVEGEKKVRMSISTVGSYLRMTVRNSVEEGKEISFTKTSKKEDRENHGIGIRSMRHIVERYSGSMRYEREGDEVELTIIMCII